ncbi:MAG: DotD/TraH family lipoprotein [Pseudomonas sp.]|nr:DotD/TraH family lipoprotein [Pseudomonas sp.]
MRFTTTLAPLALALLLGGCASFPQDTAQLPTSSKLAQDQDKKWASLPAVRHVSSGTGMSIRRVAPLPGSLADRQISFHLSAKASLDEIGGALATQGIPVVLKTPTDKASEAIRITNFSGSLRDFLDRISVAHDLNYEYQQGTVILSLGVRHMIVLPQYADFLKRIPVGLEGIGAKNVKADIDTGLVTFDASLSVSSDAKLFIERLANNSSMVSLQVAVIDVRLNRDSSQGFDWNEFSAKWGSLIDASLTAATPVTTILNGTAKTVETVERALGSMATATGSSIGLKIDENKFSLVAALKMLSKYGKTKTDQDVLISTLSGAPVKISSGSQIPYVSSVGAVASQGGAVSGSVSTAVLDSGINIDINPHYDQKDNLVVTSVKARLSSLIRFRELNAGLTVGTISQPEVQKLEFENVSRLRPGEIIMLGGVTYDQLAEEYTSVTGAEDKPIGSKATATNRHAIFIVIRPSVTVFNQQKTELSVKQGGLYEGDPTDLLDYLASLHGLHFQSTGKKIPLHVSVVAFNRSIDSILDDVRLQLNGKAVIGMSKNHLDISYKEAF